MLRIEDIDQSRARPEWETQIYSDLAWLGLNWPTPVMRQSDQQGRYDAALNALWDQGLLYPCSCNRRDIKDALSAPQEGAPMGPDGIIYPGTCRHKDRPQQRPSGVNLRLDIQQAVSGITSLEFTECMHVTAAPKAILVKPTSMIQTVSDVVLSRRDMGTSYHLSVVLDDATQGITDVVRGKDLFEATHIHILLQHLMGLTSPKYHHHKLIRDETGKRLAKRDDARAISTYREDGFTPKDVKKLVGLG